MTLMSQIDARRCGERKKEKHSNITKIYQCQRTFLLVSKKLPETASYGSHKRTDKEQAIITVFFTK